jgi:iron complex outermembrane receptor protein
MAQADGQTADADEVSPDIIVTARRVEERLQDVPISMTVFDQGQLNDRNVFSAKDLATYTPSLATNTRFGNDSSSFAIRGFSQELRTTASVGTYFADVVSPRGGGSTQGGDGAGPGNFFDLQNVQVLKGPQGTLFGRNTTGGAVLLVPKKPTDKLEGYVEGSLGNYNMRRVQGVVNAPLSGTFRVRAGVDWQKRDGYLKNISGIGPQDFANVDYVAARLSILGELTPDLENYVVASYTKSQPHGAIPKLTDCFGPVPAGSVPAGLPAALNNALFPFGALSCQQVAREAGQGWNAVSNSLFNASQEVEQWQVINTTTWKASDNLTIKNIVSYAQLKQVQHVDLFGTDWIIPATLTSPSGVAVNTGAFAGSRMVFVTAESIPNRSTNNQSTFTEELQFQGKSSDGRLVWQAGGYFELSQPLGFYGAQNPSRLSCANSGNFQCTDIFRALAAANPTAGLAGATGTLGYQGVKTEFRDIGVYAQASYDLTEQLKLTGGIRYTWDRTRSVAEKLTYRFLTPNVPTGFCTNPLVRSPALPISAVNATSECREFQDQNSKAPTWLLGLDFKPSRDILLYAKWARGYRQGATNPFGPDGLPPFKQEKVDTYEVGTKASFRGAISGTFNLSGFYNDFRDQQLNASFTTPLITGLAPNAGIVNVGKSRIYGIEVETMIMPFEGFRIQGSYAYLNTKIQELSPIPAVPNFGPASHLSVLGGELPFTPKHKLSVSANYTLPLDESIGKITFGTTYSYNGKMFTAGPSSAATATLLNVFNKNDVLYIPSYDLWDINVSWENVAQSNIDASFFMTNVANKHYYLARNIQATSGFISRYLGEPRTWGFRLRYNFGAE